MVASMSVNAQSGARAPLVSIVMPMHNSADHIVETIESVLAQTYQNFELIAVDDASRDNTLDVVAQIGDPRIRVVALKDNVGAGHARNAGIEAASGDFLALLDSDDRWYPQKLAHQLELMEREGSAMCYTRYDLIDGSGKHIGDSGPLAKHVTYDELLKHCIIRTSSLVIDLGALSEKVYFPTIRKRQDFVFFLRLLKQIPKADLLDEITCSYRLHSGTVSSNKLRVIPFQWNVYRVQEGLPLTKSVRLMAGWFFSAGMVNMRRVADWIRTK